MANERGKAVDKTHLSVDQAEERGFIHRDYIAHCFRWTHAAKLAYKMHKDLRVLDVGCGKEMPFGKLLYTSKLSPKAYAAVDMNKLELPDVLKQAEKSGKTRYVVLPQQDAAQLTNSMLRFKPNLITCFEVLEHVEPLHAKAILKTLKDVLDYDGTLLVSTPCYDHQVGAAANHVNEMTYKAFGWLLEHCGFEIEDHWGTFASQKDYKEQLVADDHEDHSPGNLEHSDVHVSQSLWDRLSSYYDSNVLATIFAPVFPQLARNCCWQLKKANKTYERRFMDCGHSPQSSSDKWNEQWEELKL